MSEQQITPTPGAFFEVTGAESELFRIVEGINRNEDRETADSSMTLDLWQEMLEEWHARRDAKVRAEDPRIARAIAVLSCEPGDDGGDPARIDDDYRRRAQSADDALAILVSAEGAAPETREVSDATVRRAHRGWLEAEAGRPLEDWEFVLRSDAQARLIRAALEAAWNDDQAESHRG